MTNLLSVLVPYFSLSLGYQIYRSPPEVGESAPLISLLIFLTALLLLLINLEIYPCNLRSLGWFGTLIIEDACVFFQFLISYFLMENLMIDFWFPLEETVSQLPTKIADGLDEVVTCGSFCDTLRSDKTKVVTSYMMSGLLLLMVLHATRLIDLRKLAQGPSSFFGDILLRLKLSLTKMLQGLGLCPENRVRISSDNSGKRENIRWDPCNGNTSTNSNSSNLGGDDYERNYKYTRRRSRRRCK